MRYLLMNDETAGSDDLTEQQATELINSGTVYICDYCSRSEEKDTVLNPTGAKCTVLHYKDVADNWK